MTRSGLVKLFTFIERTYINRRKFEAADEEVWAFHLRDLGDKEALHALWRWGQSKDGHFPPNPPDLVRIMSAVDRAVPSLEKTQELIKRIAGPASGLTPISKILPLVKPERTDA